MTAGPDKLREIVQKSRLNDINCLKQLILDRDFTVEGALIESFNAEQMQYVIYLVGGIPRKY